jgi:hypothetical protein
MSKQKTPVLAGAIPSLERMMSRLERLAKKHPELRVPINRGLKFAVKYYERMDYTDAYVVAMCEFLC